MKIEKLEPGKLVVWSCEGDHREWEGTTLTWNISSEDGATMLRLTHAGWKSVSDFYAMCNSTWGELMYRLQGYLEGKTPARIGGNDAICFFQRRRPAIEG